MSKPKRCNCHPSEPKHIAAHVLANAGKPGKSNAFKLVSKRADLRSRQPRSAVTVTQGKPRKPLSLAERRARAADRSYSAVLVGTR